MEREEAIDLLISVAGDINKLTPSQYQDICEFFPNTPKQTESPHSDPPQIRSKSFQALKTHILKRYDLSGDIEDIDHVSDLVSVYNTETSIPEIIPDLIDTKIVPDLVAEIWDEIERTKQVKKLIHIDGEFEIEQVPLRDGLKVIRTKFENSPTEGIVIVTQITYPGNPVPINNRKIIFEYFISEITRHEDPTDRYGICYTIRFIDPADRTQDLMYYETSLEYIIADISKGRPGMNDRHNIGHAILNLVNKFHRHDLVKREVKLPATGFFLDKQDKIIYNQSPSFKPTLPDKPDPLVLKRAFESLTAAILFYAKQADESAITPENAGHILSYLYYYIQAPLGLIRKQSGIENQYLFVYGLPHTGKTWFAKWGAALWGMTQDQGIIGAASLTEPQMAGHFNRTTFPLCLDEVRNALKNPRICESLKSGSTGIIIKNRINSQANFKVDQFHAYASFILTANHVPELYIGMEDRILPIEFTTMNKNPDEAAIKQFEHLLYKTRSDLSHIGAALRDLFCREPDLILRLVRNNPQIKAGYEILTVLLSRHGIPKPKWLVLTEVAREIQEANPVEILYEFLKESYIDRLRQHVWRDVRMPILWNERLEQLRVQNIMPPHTINISSNYIVVKATISHEIARKTGCELPGGAKGLAAMIPGSKYQPYKGSKVLMIPRLSFVEYATPTHEYQIDQELEECIG